MNAAELNEIIKSIKPAGRQAIINAKARQDSLAKPPGSLGGLEEISIRIAGMTGKEINRIEENDVVFYEDPELYGQVLLKEGDLIVVAPEDAHKPRCAAGTPAPVKKVVVKVKM